MNESFRYRKLILIQAIGVTPLTFAATIWFASMPLLGGPGKHGFGLEQTLGAVCIALFMGGMTLLGVHTFASYFVDRITVAGSTVFITTVFQKRQFDKIEVDKLGWKAIPNGRIDFYVAGQRTKIELECYSDEDRLRMIRLFRGLIAEEKQVDWPMFCHRIALPLRDRVLGPSAGELARPVAADEIMITRRRYDRLAAVVLPASLIVVLACWWATGSPVGLALPLILVLSWLFLRFSTQREGQRTERVAATPHGRMFLLAHGVLYGSMVLFCLLEAANVRREIVTAIMLLIVAPISPFLIYGFYNAVKDKELAIKIAATAAPGVWDEGEPGRLQPLPV